MFQPNAGEWAVLYAVRLYGVRAAVLSSVLNSERPDLRRLQVTEESQRKFGGTRDAMQITMAGPTPVWPNLVGDGATESAG
jgi:hypothetical protein